MSGARPVSGRLRPCRHAVVRRDDQLAAAPVLKAHWNAHRDRVLLWPRPGSHAAASSVRTATLAAGSSPPCLVGMAACATSHHWAREIEALGHQVRLMPPRYVKPYVKRNKNDRADAEAIYEAVTRPTMRFVEIETADQRSVLMLHRTR